VLRQIYANVGVESTIKMRSWPDLHEFPAILQRILDGFPNVLIGMFSQGSESPETARTPIQLALYTTAFKEANSCQASHAHGRLHVRGLRFWPAPGQS